MISDREAAGYLVVGASVSVLFSVAIVTMSLAANSGKIDAGHVYSVMTYIWTYAISLDDAPRLIESFSNLKDIGKRVKTEI